jgi:ankyrin repeat protein
MDHREFLDAVRSGELEAVRRWLELNPKLSAARAEGGETAVLLAVYHGHPDVAKLLAGDESGLDVHEAAALGAEARLRRLLTQEPGRVSSYSDDGWTALHLAAFFGHGEAVRLLLDAGAATEARAHNRQDNMPLHAATAGRHRGVAAALVRHGADVGARNAEGMTPMHMAAYAGDIGLLALFVDAGAGLDARDSRGQSPLGLAIEQGRQEAAAWLRERGAGE